MALASSCGLIILLYKESLEEFGGEAWSFKLCMSEGRLINSASEFEVDNAPEAVEKERGLGEGRGCWVQVSCMPY